MMDKITVILPIYGVEDYLESCIKAVLDQTYRNLEVILVDDGSKDRCPEICDEWAQKDERILVIHKPNGGLSDARNAGIRVATGEYYLFVDSDDLIHPQMIELLYAHARKKNSLMVGCCYREFCSEKELEIEWINKTVPGRFYTTEEAITESCSDSSIHNCFIVAWNRIYHKSLFEHIQYPVGHIHEDALIAFQLLEAANGIYLLEEELYFYRQRNGSIKNSEFSEKEIDTLLSIEKRLEIADSKNVTVACQYLVEQCLKYCIKYSKLMDRKKQITSYKIIKVIYKRVTTKYVKYLSFQKKVKYSIKWVLLL